MSLTSNSLKSVKASYSNTASAFCLGKKFVLLTVNRWHHRPKVGTSQLLLSLVL